MADHVVRVVDNRALVRPYGAELLTGTAIAQAAGRIAALRGRASLYGETVPVRADLFVGDTLEAAFTDPYYREGYSRLDAPSDLTGWEFYGGGAYATSADGRLTFFPVGTPRITNAGLAVSTVTTNLALHSNALDNAAWVKSGTGVTANAGNAPDGTNTADRMVPTAGGGTHSFSQTVTVAEGRATVTIYAKAEEVEWLAIQLIYAGDNPVSYFNVADAALGSVATTSSAVSTIEVLANGWRRLRMSANVPAGSFAPNVYACSGNLGGSYVANGTDGILLWGAQFEPGGVASDLVPTTTTAATSEGDNAALLFAPDGDFTVFVEADVPALAGAANILASVVGPVLEARIVIYRNEPGAYVLQVYNSGGLLTATAQSEPGAHRVRAAFSSEAGQTRACFNGGDIVTITAPRPFGLLRAWAGALALNQGDELDGDVRSLLVHRRASTDTELRRMTLDPSTLLSSDISRNERVVTALIEEALTAHGNDQQPHDLPRIKRTADLAEAKTGLWSVVASDTFTGANGALTTTETGAKTWIALGGNAIHRIGGVAKSPDGSLRGTAFLTGFKDGQLEADLNPGTSHAGLYFRWDSIGNHLYIQRNADGAIAISKFIGGAVTLLAQTAYPIFVAGERWKIRYVGPRVWVFRIVAGVETLIFDVTETQWQDKTGVGIRLESATATADNFRVLGREAL